MERKKIVHTLDTPYTAVEWPQVSQEEQDAILELLCRLLAPLGTHRRSFIAPSKGKRRRAQKKASSTSGKPGDLVAPTPVPPTPELAAYVDVGLSRISRTLQSMSAGKDEPAPLTEQNNSHYSVVFAARAGHSSAFHCHFPQMVALAAQSQSPEKAVRLVGLSKACEDRLSTALGIPRVSSIALREDAPQAKGLIDFVREHVAPVRISWLQEARSAKFLETKIDAVPTRIGNKKPRLS
ncbi:hypothetical protein N656DRAFT_703913 [Canariomyces notabilis]|uniref:Uncharacterized protein n=1 Tax=Canariomyces notabilis TaxID=2074819 RepID=A0AAN6YVC5_9PEZI|nr:hypothetical protein N656DRAFT_703913 [Canariomyces arenarius]